MYEHQLWELGRLVFALSIAAASFFALRSVAMNCHLRQRGERTLGMFRQLFDAVKHRVQGDSSHEHRR